MDTTITNTLITSGAALLGGVIGYKVKWGIELKRKTYERRLALIDRWRSLLAHSEFDRVNLLTDETYPILSDLLTEKTRKQLGRSENEFYILVGDARPGRNLDRDPLLQEIARIEREWKII